MLDFVTLAFNLRAEAERNAKTAAYLASAAKAQAITADYIEKQFKRGDYDLCTGAIDGLCKLLTTPDNLKRLVPGGH